MNDDMRLRAGLSPRGDVGQAPSTYGRSPNVAASCDEGQTSRDGSVPTAAAAAVYAALDLGTNNCRLLIASPTDDGFRVVDSFSRIIRLGEGISATGRISEAAIGRAIAALGICRDKMHARKARRVRRVAAAGRPAAPHAGAIRRPVGGGA